MADGAPVPILVSEPQPHILCIADMKEAASKRLPSNVQGNHSGPIS